MRHFRRGATFFFQAEDGIRDFHVTGVQTCALPISPASAAALSRSCAAMARSFSSSSIQSAATVNSTDLPGSRNGRAAASTSENTITSNMPVVSDRSEERRVGKEWRSRWSRYHEKKKGFAAVELRVLEVRVPQISAVFSPPVLSFYRSNIRAQLDRGG